jgi:hypothetical protein
MKKQSIIKSAVGLLAVLSLSFTGCKKFLDVNTNPNQSSNVTPDLLLPTAQAELASVLGVQYQVYGSIWSEYWTQSTVASQYKAVDQYLVNNTAFDRCWQYLYAEAMTDLQKVIDQGGVEKYRQYAGIATILKAYDFQLITDAFGDVPLKDAIQGENANYAPKYDPQSEVYDTIFALIDRGRSMIDPKSDFSPGSNDVILNGDLDQWIQFANTLELRAYLRLSLVDANRSAAGIAKLQGASFLTGDASMKFFTAGGNQNPLYAEITGLGGTQNLDASETAVSHMYALNDPRLFVFYAVPKDTVGTIVSIPQGTFASAKTYLISTPSVWVGGKPKTDSSATAPLKFMSGSESYFLQAEATVRGSLAGGNAQQLFKQGIEASFASWGVDTALSNPYVNAQVAAWPATQEAQIQAIITQKYYAMNGNQGFEAWTEWRRTGYPDFLIVSHASTLTDATAMPARFLYPSTEGTRNPNFPGAKVITDKVWWDVN